jgi:hypothetical protein
MIVPLAVRGRENQSSQLVAPDQARILPIDHRGQRGRAVARSVRGCRNKIGTGQIGKPSACADSSIRPRSWERAISADTAIRLGKYFGLPAQFWLNLQNDYDLRIAAANGAGAGIKPRKAEAATPMAAAAR